VSHREAQPDLLALCGLNEWAAGRDGLERVAAHCDALGAILRRHEPNGYG